MIINHQPHWFSFPDKDIITINLFFGSYHHLPTSQNEKKSRHQHRNVEKNMHRAGFHIYAAAFVVGGHANGLTEWKTTDGRSLREIESYEGKEM